MEIFVILDLIINPKEKKLFDVYNYYVDLATNYICNNKNQKL